MTPPNKDAAQSTQRQVCFQCAAGYEDAKHSPSSGFGTRTCEDCGQSVSDTHGFWYNASTKIAAKEAAQSEHERFEALADSAGYAIERKSSGDYYSRETHHAWEGFQLAALAPPVAEQPITYTVNGEVMTPLEYIDHLHGKLAEPVAAPAQAVAWAVTSERGGIHKLAVKRESAERKAQAWQQEWPNNNCRVRPLVFGDAAPPAAQPMTDYRINPEHEAADAFWKYWRENGETGKHGYYESTWGAINAAIKAAGVRAIEARGKK